ncbi:MAG: hypothetical protein RL417_838 [Pseudomonadota bacterium]|jgi:kynurenine formamidase
MKSQDSNREGITFRGIRFEFDSGAGFDISLYPSMEGSRSVSAFGADPISTSAVVTVADQKRCNCYSFDGFAPHLHGTHTETRQHIVREPRPVAEILTTFRFIAKLVSLDIERADPAVHSLTVGGDSIVTREALERKLSGDQTAPEMLIIRTPNFVGKRTMHYGGTNPPYPHHAIGALCVERGIEHIILDLPSADREEGQLYFHRTFWRDPVDGNGGVIPELRHISGPTREKATITELAFIDDGVPDGWYLCHLIPIGFPGDAAPVRPIITPLQMV